MLQNITKPLFLLVLILVSTACGTRKSSITEATERLPKVKEELLIYKLDSLSKQRPEHFFTRINSRYSDNNTNISFKTSIRMHSDSALQATITFANIPIYNAIITPDTLTLVDRRDKCYILEDMGFLKKSFNIDFTHRNIEEVFLGLPVAWDSKIKYHQIKDPYNYIISAYTEKDIEELDAQSEEIITRYYLNSETKLLEKVIIDSPKDTTSIKIYYSDFQLIENFSIPSNVEINIKTARNDIFIDFKYTKTAINDPRTLFLAIPDKYEKCE